MNKQEYLDQDKMTNEIWTTQQLISKMNKTQLTNAMRAFKQIYDAAYKSWARDQSFDEMYRCLKIATVLVIDDTDDGYES